MAPSHPFVGSCQEASVGGRHEVEHQVLHDHVAVDIVALCGRGRANGPGLEESLEGGVEWEGYGEGSTVPACPDTGGAGN